MSKKCSAWRAVIRKGSRKHEVLSILAGVDRMPGHELFKRVKLWWLGRASFYWMMMQLEDSGMVVRSEQLYRSSGLEWNEHVFSITDLGRKQLK